MWNLGRASHWPPDYLSSISPLAPFCIVKTISCSHVCSWTLQPAYLCSTPTSLQTAACNQLSSLECAHWWGDLVSQERKKGRGSLMS